MTDQNREILDELRVRGEALGIEATRPSTGMADSMLFASLSQLLERAELALGRAIGDVRWHPILKSMFDPEPPGSPWGWRTPKHGELIVVAMGFPPQFEVFAYFDDQRERFLEWDCFRTIPAVPSDHLKRR